MKLIRILVLDCLIHNVRVFAKYIKSQDNTTSDYLPRMRINDFKKLNANWDAEPMIIPQELWPVNKIFD